MNEDECKKFCVYTYLLLRMSKQSEININKRIGLYNEVRGNKLDNVNKNNYFIINGSKNKQNNIEINSEETDFLINILNLNNIEESYGNRIKISDVLCFFKTYDYQKINKTEIELISLITYYICNTNKKESKLELPNYNNVIDEYTHYKCIDNIIKIISQDRLIVLDKYNLKNKSNYIIFNGTNMIKNIPITFYKKINKDKKQRVDSHRNTIKSNIKWYPAKLKTEDKFEHPKLVKFDISNYEDVYTNKALFVNLMEKMKSDGFYKMIQSRIEFDCLYHTEEKRIIEQNYYIYKEFNKMNQSELPKLEITSYIYHNEHLLVMYLLTKLIEFCYNQNEKVILENKDISRSITSQKKWNLGISLENPNFKFETLSRVLKIFKNYEEAFVINYINCLLVSFVNKNDKKKTKKIKISYFLNINKFNQCNIRYITNTDNWINKESLNNFIIKDKNLNEKIKNKLDLYEFWRSKNEQIKVSYERIIELIEKSVKNG